MFSKGCILKKTYLLTESRWKCVLCFLKLRLIFPTGCRTSTLLSAKRESECFKETLGATTTRAAVQPQSPTSDPHQPITDPEPVLSENHHVLPGRGYRDQRDQLQPATRGPDWHGAQQRFRGTRGGGSWSTRGGEAQRSSHQPQDDVWERRGRQGKSYFISPTTTSRFLDFDQVFLDFLFHVCDFLNVRS